MSPSKYTPEMGSFSAADSGPIEPVRTSIRVRANASRAFKVFTEGLDSWWPKSHHVGASPMTRAVMEGRVNGRVYSEQDDGNICEWGQILVWEPPARFVMAWRIKPTWELEPDAGKCSEVEVNFTPASDGSTLVELEHRYFERHGEGAAKMREQVGQPGGWGGLLELFKTESELEG
jgi:Activator of Hsp90 ATPase homolog 1-like protein